MKFINKLKPALINLLIVIVALTALCVILELLVRTLQPESGIDYFQRSETRGYSLKINYKININEIPFETNSKGLRDRDFGPKDKETFRILMLGDSITMGKGVHLNETFSKKLESMLNTYPLYSQYSQYQVINAGITGYNTHKQFELLKEFGLEYTPDLVILCYLLNDAVPTAVFPLDAAFMNSSPQLAEALRKVYDLSYLLRFIRVHLKNLYLKLNPLNYPVLFAKNSPGWKESQSYLKAMAALTHQKGIPFLVLIYPQLIDLSDAHPYIEIYDIIQQFNQDNNISSKILFPYYKGKTDTQLWLSLTDRHMNSQGHKLTADIIFEILQKQ